MPDSTPALITYPATKNKKIQTRLRFQQDRDDAPAPPTKNSSEKTVFSMHLAVRQDRNCVSALIASTLPSTSTPTPSCILMETLMTQALFPRPNLMSNNNASLPSLPSKRKLTHGRSQDRKLPTKYINVACPLQQ